MGECIIYHVERRSYDQAIPEQEGKFAICNGKSIMALSVSIKPDFFTWAIRRSGKEMRQLRKKFKKLPEWTEGTGQPTLRQLEEFAKATFVPIGYFFLNKPPDEAIPISDFRTMKNVEISHPSPNLLDTIYLCQQRQYWYHNFVRSEYGEKVSFVGSLDRKESIEKTAENMRSYFKIDLEENKKIRTWEEYLKLFVNKVRERGVMVMISGIVRSNTRRKLDTNEFRGFALSEDFAPLIFINGADSKSAQMFTLAHELAHIGLGKSVLSNADLFSRPSNNLEVWCNKVAAEFLVPLKSIKETGLNNLKQVPELTRIYKVSSLVILRRLFDAKSISRNEFERAYKKECKRLIKISQKKGGDFYRTTESRVGTHFARDVMISVFEGQTTFTEAMRLLCVKRAGTLNTLGKRLGVVLE